MNSYIEDIFAIRTLLLFFIIYNIEGNGIEGDVAETSSPLKSENVSASTIPNENKNWRGHYWNSNFEIGESSECKEIANLNENAIKTEKSDVSPDYSSDGMKFECKSEEEEDDTNHNDVGEIGEFYKNKMHKYAVADSNNNFIQYEIEMYCKECDEPFDAISSFEKHNVLNHRKKKIFICEYENCRIGFTLLRNLYSHHHKTHGLRFRKVRINETQVGKKDVVCRKCGDMFQRASEFERHYAKFHKDEGKLVLKGKEERDKYESDVGDSDAEIMGANEENDFSKNKIFTYAAVGPDRNTITYEFETHCRECDEPFYTINSYESHFIRSHSKKRIFPCNIENCDRSFSRLWNLYYHHWRIHGLRFRRKSNHRKGFSNVTFDELSGGFPTYCEECRLECNTTHSLQMHAKGRHPSRKIFVCMVTDCRSAYTTASNLMYHLNVKHGRRKKKKLHRAAAKSSCPLCGRSFDKVKDVYDHAREAHPREKLWKCSFCAITFTKTSNRNRHEKIMHGNGGRSPGHCRYCRKIIITLNYLPIHETNCKERKQPQTDDTPPATSEDVYECEECGKIFHKKRWKYFAYHKHQHKRYARCPICNWRIDVGGGLEILKSHVELHHPRKYEEVDFETLLISKRTV